MKNYRILYCGDTAFSVEFGSSISPAANALVHALAAELEKYRGIESTYQMCEIGMFRSPDGKRIVGLARSQSHNNPAIKKLYKEYLGMAGGMKAHKLLHTHFVDRKNID